MPAGLNPYKYTVPGTLGSAAAPPATIFTPTVPWIKLYPNIPTKGCIGPAYEVMLSADMATRDVLKVVNRPPVPDVAFNSNNPPVVILTGKGIVPPLASMETSPCMPAYPGDPIISTLPLLPFLASIFTSELVKTSLPWSFLIFICTTLFNSIPHRLESNILLPTPPVRIVMLLLLLISLTFCS